MTKEKNEKTMNDKKIALRFAKKNGFSIVASKKDDAGQVYFEAYAGRAGMQPCDHAPKNCSDRGEGRMDGEIERSTSWMIYYTRSTSFLSF